MRGGLLLVTLVLAACGSDAPPVAATPTFAIDTNRITVSGVSSGAMMATQMHVALSDIVHGSAMVGLPALIDYAKSNSASGAIDDVANLGDDPVWLFSGKNDAGMHTDVSRERLLFRTGRHYTSRRGRCSGSAWLSNPVLRCKLHLDGRAIPECLQLRCCW